MTNTLTNRTRRLRTHFRVIHRPTRPTQIGCPPLPTLSPVASNELRRRGASVGHTCEQKIGGPQLALTNTQLTPPPLFIYARPLALPLTPPHTWSLLDTPSQRRVFAVAVVAQKTEPESRLRRIQGRKLAHRPALGIPLPSIQIFFARRYRVGGLVPPPQRA